jgi:predicted SprT family Zn-dependent metalloprotease
MHRLQWRPRMATAASAFLQHSHLLVTGPPAAKPLVSGVCHCVVTHPARLHACMFQQAYKAHGNK